MNVTIMICTIHGCLSISDVIKCGINKNNGKQFYRCKQCFKMIRNKHYKNNKEKILSAHKKYKEKNPEKYRKIKNESQRRMRLLNLDKYRKKSLEYDKKNPDKKSVRQKRYKDKSVKYLSDIYVKQNIVRGTTMTVGKNLWNGLKN